ncbi:MAG: cytochrome c family protein [Proteobacteria bacterium]|nr:cytochrome c family protein [Pseudomonadota bacterium]
MEINKIVASVLVAGLIFMGISVGVDEVLRKEPLEKVVYPVPALEMAAAPAKAESEAAVPLAVLLVGADPRSGQKVAKKCVACHDLSQGGKHKIGPNLWDIVGSARASRNGFSYSGTLSGLGGTWTYDELDAFLAGPKAYAPGNKMIFSGLKKPAQRADLLAFLRTLSENPQPLPAAE